MLDLILKEADSFYKVPSKNFIIALQKNLKCFDLKCFDMSCNCECTSRCDLEFGETINTIYRDAVEISKEKFQEMWISCQN